MSIPRNRSCASVHDCPGNRVRYTPAARRPLLAIPRRAGPARSLEIGHRAAAVACRRVGGGGACLATGPDDLAGTERFAGTPSRRMLFFGSREMW